MVPVGSGSMVYTINQKVITLEEYGYSNFKDELVRLGKENNLYDKRNLEWFNILPDTFFNYEEWFFLFDDDRPVAFSTIQKYDEGTYRLLTRTYIYRDYRRFMSPKKDTFLSPTMCLVPYQLDYIGEYQTVFVSMQSLSRRQALKRFAEKLEYQTNLKWEMVPDMMLTCDQDYGKDCWQSIIHNGKKPNLQEMTIEEWKNKWQKSA